MHARARGDTRISRSTVALCTVCVAGGLLTIFLPDPQTENVVQIGMSGILVWIILRGHQKADAAIDAALHLAEELAKQRTFADQAMETGLAEVVPLNRAGRPQAS